MQRYCSVSPLECIFMAPLTLFNEAPKRKSIAPLTLWNVFSWLSWPSLMRGTRPFSNMWESLCGTSCGRGFYMVPLAYGNGMVPH